MVKLLRIPNESRFVRASAAYLAYRVRDNRLAAHTATEASPVSSAEPYVKALAVIGCAADPLTLWRRPSEIEGNDLTLPEWWERVWKLLFAMPDDALPRPSMKTEAACEDTDSPEALTQEHAAWCIAGDHSNERNRES